MRYKCKEEGCTAAFVRISGLKDHEIVAHTKKYNFNCDICDKGFLRKSQLLGEKGQFLQQPNRNVSEFLIYGELPLK